MSSLTQTNINDFHVHDAQGKDLKLSDLLKQVTLIVNIDCKIGEDANHECKDLQELYMRHSNKGFEIIAFPSDQFQIITDQGNYVSAMEVQMDLNKRYGVTFPIMHKIDVNGDRADPLFLFLQKRLSGFPTNAIKWDFTKFLIVDGEPTKRYAPTTSPLAIEDEIVEALDNLGMSGVRSEQKDELTQGTDAGYGSYGSVPPSINPTQEDVITSPIAPESFPSDVREPLLGENKDLGSELSKLTVSDSLSKQQDSDWLDTQPPQQANIIDQGSITQDMLELRGEREPVRMDLFYIQQRDKKLMNWNLNEGMPPQQEVVSDDRWMTSGNIEDKLSSGDTNLRGSAFGSLKDESGMPVQGQQQQGFGDASDVKGSGFAKSIKQENVAGVSCEPHLQGIKPASHFHENETVMSDLHHRRHLQEYERE